MSRIIILLMLTSYEANAEWVLLYNNPHGNYKKYYWSSDTLKIDGSIRKNWILIELIKPRKLNTEEFNSVVMRYEFDCKDDWLKIFNFIYYSGSMGTGEILLHQKDSEEDLEWLSAPPGSLNLGLIKFACSK